MALALALVAGAPAVTAAATATAPGGKEPARIPVVFLRDDEPPVIPLSLLDPVIEDPGVQGARLAVADNQTTGRFMGQSFELVEVTLPEGDPAEAVRALAGEGHRFFVADLRADRLLAVADLPELRDALVFNARATDDRLRNADCRANVLHTAPSRAMLADALAQYLMYKRWTNWFLVQGRGDDDALYAEALRRAAKRFGAKIVDEKTWAFAAGSRRSDSGHTTEQAEIPAFTQGAAHDVVVVADEGEAFGEYIAYRTFRPQVVAGTHGLVPTAWARVHEQWGATQFQDRFEKLAGRIMAPRDYGAWMAVRSIGEAATRARSADPAAIAAYIRDPRFTLAAFKGVGVTIRPWDGQYRQPVLLAGPRILVSVSPQPGFLHEHSELDTLGHDRPESGCRLPGR
ncbi:ABC transporter substrate-binding protein [Azospirillum halopraeferens]|uniref:ABC transporter substrate-binding protein n=1 Tax=Azospirillum halopraeferens TaxID=34010 RepID=UPI0003FCD87C|nr:ABC transporter substrate-binding protein [Azospirillum halopraeferens]